MKSYVYKPSRYFVSHTLTGVFTLIIGLACIGRMIFAGFSGVLLIVTILCIYNVWNEFISLSNPSEVDIDDETITFRDSRRVHSYKICDIKEFSMRMVAGNTSVYMKINQGGFLRGRYWVRVDEFNDTKELTDYFYDLDEKVNPNSMFTKARKDGRKRLDKKQR